MFFSSNSTFAVSRKQRIPPFKNGPEPAINWKPKTSQPITLKKVTLMSCIPEPAIQSCLTVQRIPFWQLSIDYNMDVQYQVKPRYIYIPWTPSKCTISHPLTWIGERTYVRTILSEPKFLGCIDNQIFLPLVLRSARFALRARKLR